MPNTVAITAAALNALDASAPDWVQLTPPGPRFAGLDGRTFSVADPAALVAAFNDDARPMPVDFEHATHLKGERGEAAPAVGWVNALELRDGAVWGRVDWLDAGREAVASRAYRYVSPVLLADAASRAVRKIVSVGLTNAPNLKMAALNFIQETPMDLKPLAEALGLTGEPSPADLVLAANRLKAAAEQPDLARFVPRADHELALNRAATAEAALKAQRDAAAEAEIVRAVDEAVAAGKIAPASRDYHLAACRAEGGLEKFRAFAAAAPRVVTDAKPAPKVAGPDGLSDEELYTCRMLGIDRAEFVKLKEEAA